MTPYVQPAALRAASIDLSPYLFSGKPKRRLPKLIVLDGSEELRRLGPKQTPEAVARATAIRGQLGLDGVSLMTLNPDGKFGYHWPKGIPWTAFPILSKARYRPFGVKGYPTWEPGSVQPISLPEITLEECLAAAETVVITDGSDFHLDRSRIFLSQHPDIDRITIFRQMPDGTLEALDQDQFGALGPRSSLSERFEYSYEINFRAIGGKILSPMFEGFSVDYDTLERQGFEVSRRASETPRRRFLSEDRSFGFLSYPESLQVLYILRKKGSVPWEMPHEAVAWKISERRALAVSSLVHVIGMGVESAFFWVGTGKYAPVQINHGWLGWLVTDLLRTGLMEFAPGGDSVRLSPIGTAFLNKLPKDCEDPDIVGRWQGLDAVTAAPSMDAWLLRFFRKMKVAANKS